MIAGGGGGGSGAGGSAPYSGGGGGGGGRYIDHVLAVTPGVTYTLNVGGGGPAKANSGNGFVGYNTTFGEHIPAQVVDNGWCCSLIRTVAEVAGT